MRLSLAPQLPRSSPTSDRLRQIMLNLLSNAVKFNEPGGQVIVSTALDRRRPCRDPGARHRRRHGGSRSRSGARAVPPGGDHRRKTTGTGLGLPLTKALVEANGAAFTIKSRRDQGTLVEISFPAVEAAERVRRHGPERNPGLSAFNRLRRQTQPCCGRPRRRLRGAPSRAGLDPQLNLFNEMRREMVPFASCRALAAKAIGWGGATTSDARFRGHDSSGERAEPRPLLMISFL